MDAIAHELSEYLISRLENVERDSRLIVGISGIPASGKSTLAQLIVVNCNEALAKSGSESEAIMVGLDGWHLTRAQLDAFPDPQQAHARRGAFWTFDGNGYVAFVKALRTPYADSGEKEAAIHAPAFDHAVKDPEPNAVAVRPTHRLVVIEGLYTFLSVEPWREAGVLLDERWFVDIEEAEAESRLVQRHVLTGVAKDMAEAKWRADENDMPNGRFIKENMITPTRIIPSVDDPIFAHHHEK